MAYIVKSSLEIKSTIVPWNEIENEKLIKEKKEFLEKKKEADKTETKTEMKTESKSDLKESKNLKDLKNQKEETEIKPKESKYENAVKVNKTNQKEGEK